MFVLASALADQDDVLAEGARALHEWYWLVRKVPITSTDMQKLPKITRRLAVAFRGLAEETDIATPKFHAASEILWMMEEYGVYQHLSTDTYEMHHKIFKVTYAR